MRPAPFFDLSHVVRALSELSLSTNGKGRRSADYQVKAVCFRPLDPPPQSVSVISQFEVVLATCALRFLLIDGTQQCVYEAAPGSCSGFGGGPDNPVVWPQLILSKDLTLDFNGLGTGWAVFDLHASA